jgi:hypothetical protein
VEILLNLAWAALALLIVGLWLRLGSAASTDRRRQIIAIAVLIAILFPVISVSDDLMAVQSATEQDSCQRRDYLVASSAHPVVPFAAIVSALYFEMSFGSPRFVSTRSLSLPPIEHPELRVTGDRAPPAA